jgi:hypothetical protein
MTALVFFFFFITTALAQSYPQYTNYTWSQNSLSPNSSGGWFLKGQINY